MIKPVQLCLIIPSLLVLFACLKLLCIEASNDSISVEGLMIFCITTYDSSNKYNISTSFINVPAK